MTKTRQWVVFTAVAVVVVLVAGWFMLVKPKRSHAADLRSQAMTQQQANQVLLSQIAALQSEQKNLPEQQALLQKFATRVPDNAAEPTLIRQLSAAAAGAGVDLISLTPGSMAAVSSATATSGTTSTTTPASTAPSLMQLPISIGITGSFPNVESFFQSLEKLPRALMVTGWSMCPVSTSGTSAASGGASCQAPRVPANKTVPAGTIGGTLSAAVYFAPSTAAASSTPTTSGTTAPAPASTTAATPAPTPSAATTPAS